MPSDPDYKALEAAYQACVVGGNPPPLIYCVGAFILKHRPELEGTIVPEAFYYVTAESISEVEQPL